MITHGECLTELKTMATDSVDALITDPPAGISFMGKDWDGDKGGRDPWIAWMQGVMAECLRVLKPGAHGLVWALPRTSHWTATALENAGFEIRDVVNHIFGTGFPKSLNIGKAIDKAAGVAREVTGIATTGPRSSGFEAKDRGGRKPAGERKQAFDITAPATPEAKQWDGWGTALKPAHEHWLLIRKPLGEKTVAANVLEHGTGGINVDACRIGTELIESGRSGRTECDSQSYGAGLMNTPKDFAQGRFPANLILSEESAADLDQHSGHLHGAGSRFFYIAKASKSDKGADNTHPTVKSTALMEYLIKLITPPGGTVLDPFMGSGSTGVAAQRLGFDFIGIETNEEYFEIAKKRIG